MLTITHLEDQLRSTPTRAEELLQLLHAARSRLQQQMSIPAEQQRYQQITLLLEAVIQAEDIVKIIDYRYQQKNTLLD